MAKTITADGVEIDYVSRGHGKAILFIHGWPCSQRVWDCQIHALQDRYRCVALDLRGMGHSEKADCAYTFGEFAADIRHLIKTLELQDVTLVGWSMGVSVTLEYMANYQDDGDVGRIVLINGPIKLISSDDWAFGIEKKECMQYINALVEDPINGRRNFSASNLLNPTQAEIDFLFNISMQTPLDIAMKAVTNQMDLDHRQALESVRVPCLAMQSDQDFYPVELGRYIAETAQQGSLHIFEGCGHSVQLQNY
ncbi:MAG: non-heme chloroperoxidase, partial [Planctomycetota bacterium]